MKRSKLPAGDIRPRHYPPTLAEAIFAAQGLTGDLEGQAEIASMLMGFPRDEVRQAILSSPPQPMPPMPRMAEQSSFPRPAPAPRNKPGDDRRVSVERRPPRFPIGS